MDTYIHSRMIAANEKKDCMIEISENGDTDYILCKKEHMHSYLKEAERIIIITDFNDNKKDIEFVRCG